MSVCLPRAAIKLALRKKGAMVPALNAVVKGISATVSIKGHFRALIWCQSVASVYFRCR
jgi:hypothetical protein